MQYKSLLVVIPTRNRADLAINAINSVLSQENCNFEILVSDNSTEEQAVENLSAFCAKLDNHRLHYVRPPKALAMTEHWDWAMQQALQVSEFTHITYLTDRMLFLKDSLQYLQNILTEYPDKLVSYSNNLIDDREINSPVSLYQVLWTGKLFEISSLATLKLYAEVQITYNYALPKMLNSAAPRNHIMTMFEKYGNVFSSVSPDYNFAFRSLDMVESILYYDRPLLVHYGSHRSNGMNAVNGNFNKDVLDFVSNLNSTDVCFDSPVKNICILPNCIIHEYYYATHAQKATKFPKVNQKKYLLSLIDHVGLYKNKEMREEMLGKLRSELGYSWFKYRAQSLIERKFKGLKIRLYNLFNSSTPHFLKNSFENVEEAIKYATDSPRKPVSHFKVIDDRTGIKPSKQGPVKVLKDVSGLV